MRSYSSARVCMVSTHVLLRAVAADRACRRSRAALFIARKAEQQYSTMSTVGAAQFVDGEQRRRAELGDVGEDRHLHGVLELRVHRQGRSSLPGRSCRRRLRRRRRARSIAASRPSTASASVRAMIDEVLVGAGIDGGLDAVDHFAAGVTISLPGRWPQRLAPTWSSMCIARRAGLDQRLARCARC